MAVLRMESMSDYLIVFGYVTVLMTNPLVGHVTWTRIDHVVD